MPERDAWKQVAIDVAKRVGTSPSAVAAVMSYETAGTFNPRIMGGKGGDYMGLIQFGPEERKTYKIDANSGPAQWTNAISSYLKDRGFKPGMGLKDLYSTVNAGRPGRYNASDGNGTVASHVGKILAQHVETGNRWLGLSPKDRSAAVESGRRSGGSTFDRVKAKRGAESSLDDVFRARMNVGKPGGMTAQDAAAFDAARAHGQIVGAPSWFKAPAAPRDVPELPADVLAAYNSHQMDDDPEARKAVEESVSSGAVRLPKGMKLQAPAPRSTGEKLGMYGRAAVEGLTGLADGATGAMTGRTVAAQFADTPEMANAIASPATTMASGLLDKAGAEKPQSDTENLISAGISGAVQGAVLGPVGGARGLVGRTALETVSGATSGVSAESARQAGAGPVGQFMAGLAGGVTPVGLASAARRARAPKALPEVVESTPREVMFSPDGELTPHGQDIAARHGATPEQVKQAYEAPPSVQRGVANDGETPPLAREATNDNPVYEPANDNPVYEPAPVAEPAPTVTEVPPRAAPEPTARNAAPDAAPITDAPRGALARVQDAKEVGVDLSRGQATKSFDIQDAEQRLRNSNGPEGEQMRAFVAKQNDQVKAAVDDFKSAVDDSALTPEERGTQVQEAMRELRDLGQQGVSALYKQARELGAPVELDTAPIKRTFEGLMAEAEIPEPVKKVLEAEAARYGLIGKVETTAEGALTNEAGVTTVKLDDGSKIRFRGEPKALALDTAEDFRKVVSAQYMTDGPRKLTQELKTALDDAVEEAVARTAKGGDPSIAGAMKQARQAHVEQVKTFRAKDVVQDIIDWKKGTATAKLSPEQVVQRAFAKTSDLKRIKAVLLSKPTVASKQAWTTLQAHGIATIFDKATVRNVNISGEITEAISGAKLRSQIDAFGLDKLKVLLEPEQFNQFMKLTRVIENATIPISGTVNASGSGNLVMRLMQGAAGRIPIAGKIAEPVAAIIRHAKQVSENAATVRGLDYTEAAAKVETAGPGVAPQKPGITKGAADKARSFAKDFIDTFKTPDVLAPVLVVTQQEQD